MRILLSLSIAVISFCAVADTALAEELLLSAREGSALVKRTDPESVLIDSSDKYHAQVVFSEGLVRGVRVRATDGEPEAPLAWHANAGSSPNPLFDTNAIAMAIWPLSDRLVGWGRTRLKAELNDLADVLRRGQDAASRAAGEWFVFMRAGDGLEVSLVHRSLVADEDEQKAEQEESVSGERYAMAPRLAVRDWTDRVGDTVQAALVRTTVNNYLVLETPQGDWHARKASDFSETDQGDERGLTPPTSEVSSDAIGEHRAWTSRSGKSTEAALVRMTTNGFLVLQSKEGKWLAVKNTVLADEDQRFAETEHARIIDASRVPLDELIPTVAVELPTPGATDEDGRPERVLLTPLDGDLAAKSGLRLDSGCLPLGAPDFSLRQVDQEHWGLHTGLAVPSKSLLGGGEQGDKPIALLSLQEGGLSFAWGEQSLSTQAEQVQNLVLHVTPAKGRPMSLAFRTPVRISDAKLDLQRSTTRMEVPIPACPKESVLCCVVNSVSNGFVAPEAPAGISTYGTLTMSRSGSINTQCYLEIQARDGAVYLVVKSYYQKNRGGRRSLNGQKIQDELARKKRAHAEGLSAGNSAKSALPSLRSKLASLRSMTPPNDDREKIRHGRKLAAATAQLRKAQSAVRRLNNSLPKLNEGIQELKALAAVAHQIHGTRLSVTIYAATDDHLIELATVGS